MVAHYNKDKQTDGVICDLCGAVRTDKFTYYSAKLDRVNVDRNSGFLADRDVDRRFLDLDICESCFDQMKKKILDVINRKKDSDWSTSTKAVK
jgi:hypothetical protein